MQFNFLTQQIQLLYLGSIEKWKKKKSFYWRKRVAN